MPTTDDMMKPGDTILRMEGIVKTFQAVRALDGVDFDLGAGEIHALVGMGGSQEALEAIKEGKITGTSFQQPEEEGRSAIRLAIRCLKGEKVDKRYMILCPAITKENADQFKGQF